jgi:riboflavin biosynthesis pyrimidine reductase
LRNEWIERFQQFAARKTREAVAAPLPPYVTDISNAAPGLETVGSRWTQQIFDGPFYVSAPGPQRPACSLVFVQSRDGNTTARDPSALGGGQTDKHVIYEGLSRVAADGVLAGSRTVRGSDIILSVWHPELIALRETLGKPRHPVQIVATLSGVEVERQMMFNLPEVPVVLVTVRSGAASMHEALAQRPWIRTVLMRDRDDLPAAFDALRAYGIDYLSVIGGRHLATQLVDAALVQDLYLTTAPLPGGQPDTPWYPGSWTADLVVRKLGTGEETGVRFEHWQRPRPPGLKPI